MLNTKENTYGILDLENHKDTNVEAAINRLTWPQIISTMSHHKITDVKGCEAFAAVTMKPKEEWVLSKKKSVAKPSFRLAENVLTVDLMVLDLDTPGEYKYALSVFDDFDYVLYSTYSYSLENNYKFRMVVRLEQPVPAAEWPLVFSYVQSMVGCDNSSATPLKPVDFPNANPDVTPVVKVNKGRPLAPVDLKELRSKYLRRNVPVFKKSEPSRPSKEKIQHFSGETIPANATMMDYTLEGLTRRHDTNVYNQKGELIVQSKVEQLEASNCRHEFALKVLCAEVGRFKEDTHFPSVFQFLYKAAAERSDQELFVGNTPSELPGLVEYAFTFAPEAFEKRAEWEGSGFMSYMSTCIRQCEDNHKNNTYSWGGLIERKPEIYDVTDFPSYDYASMRKRHNASLVAFIENNGNPIELAARCAASEREQFGRTNLNFIMQFTYKTYIDFNSKILKKDSVTITKDTARLKSFIAKQVALIAPSGITDAEKGSFKRKLKGALIIAEICALKNEWMFGDSPNTRSITKKPSMSPCP